LATFWPTSVHELMDGHRDYERGGKGRKIWRPIKETGWMAWKDEKMERLKTGGPRITLWGGERVFVEKESLIKSPVFSR